MDDGELAQEADIQRHTTMQIVERKDKSFTIIQTWGLEIFVFGRMMAELMIAFFANYQNLDCFCL